MKTRSVKYRTHLDCIVTQVKRRNDELGRIELDITLEGPIDHDAATALPAKRKPIVTRDFITGVSD